MFWFIKKALITGLTRTNEKRQIKQHEKCKCKCRVDPSVCNKPQNDDKCRCEWKELVDKVVCDKGFIQNPSNCECECDKSCDVGEYLDYENCKCKKKQLVEECTEEAKIAEITLTKNIHKSSSCTLYIVLFSIIFTINIGIATYFVYYKYMNHKKKAAPRYDYVY